MGLLDGLVGSAFSGIGSVATSLLGNSANIQLAREQREWDYKMWKENNEYNTPLNQMKRLRAAGINPGLAMSNGLLGNGLSSQSAGGQSAPMVDFSPIAQGLQQSVDLYQQKRLQDAQINKLNSETVNQSIRNRYENQRQIIELQQALENKDLTSSQRKHINLEIQRLFKENEFIDRKNAAEIARTEAETKQAHANTSYLELLSEGQRLVNEFAPKHQRALLGEIAAHISELYSAANANDADAAYKVALKALTNAQKSGVDIDNDTRDRMADALVDKAFNEADASYYNAGSDAKRYYGGRVGYELPLEGFSDTERYNRKVQGRQRPATIPASKRK